MINNVVTNYCARCWGFSQLYYSNSANIKDAWEDFRKMIGNNSTIIMFEAREYSKYNKYSSSLEFRCMYYHPIHKGSLTDELHITEEDIQKSTKVTTLNLELIKDLKIW